MKCCYMYDLVEYDRIFCLILFVLGLMHKMLHNIGRTVV